MGFLKKKYYIYLKGLKPAFLRKASEAINNKNQHLKTHTIDPFKTAFHKTSIKSYGKCTVKYLFVTDDLSNLQSYCNSFVMLSLHRTIKRCILKLYDLIFVV